MIDQIENAYRILTGRSACDLSREECMRTVMECWDGRRFSGDPTKERIARMALCEIGISWKEEDPYPFALVAERLRQMWPALGASSIPKPRMSILLRSLLASEESSEPRRV